MIYIFLEIRYKKVKNKQYECFSTIYCCFIKFYNFILTTYMTNNKANFSNNIYNITVSGIMFICKDTKYNFYLTPLSFLHNTIKY